MIERKKERRKREKERKINRIQHGGRQTRRGRQLSSNHPHHDRQHIARRHVTASRTPDLLTCYSFPSPHVPFSSRPFSSFPVTCTSLLHTPGLSIPYFLTVFCSSPSLPFSPSPPSTLHWHTQPVPFFLIHCISFLPHSILSFPLILFLPFLSIISSFHKCRSFILTHCLSLSPLFSSYLLLLPHYHLYPFPFLSFDNFLFPLCPSPLSIKPTPFSV